jgi:hypothetical protein
MGLTVSWRRTLVAGIAAFGLLVPASVAEAASFVARLKAPGHHPKAGKRWTIKVSARTRSGKPVRLDGLGVAHKQVAVRAGLEPATGGLEGRW